MHAETIHQQTDGLSGGPGTAPASLESLIDALGMAWTSYTLYEDPRPVAAFQRAVETLALAPGYPWRAETGVDGFAADGELLAVRREGSLRMARRLFALGTAALEFTNTPSDDDLIHLFDLLTPVDPPDDPGEALADASVFTIRLLDREMLHSNGKAEGDEYTTGTHVLRDDSPSAFVLGLLEGGDADPTAVAATFVGEYERAHLLIDIEDTWGTEELVHAFIDGFWYLPEAHRSEIFSLMLERGDRPENTVFLDQFGGTELAEMNRMFGGGGHPLLAEYLRVAAEEGGRHQDDLGNLVVGDPTESLSADIVERVAAVLRTKGSTGDRPSDAAKERLRATRPTRADSRRSTADAIRNLFHLARTPESVASMSKVWAGRVAAALAVGDLESSDAWMNTVAGLRFDEHARRGLLEALSNNMSPPAVDTLARLLIGPSPEGPGAIARKAAPLFVTTGLIRDLGTESTMTRRKMLLRALQVVARLKPDNVITHLRDPRWYVVRNVLIALGTSKHPSTADHIAPLCGHADHRVRVEALRALYRIQGTGSADLLLAGTLDTEEMVHTEACRLLGGIDDPGIDQKLLKRTRSPVLVEALRSIAALGRRDTEAARSILRGITKKRGALWGRAKRLRRAALQALEGGNG